jgi:CRP/FNR family transcriptional regulator, transcriptional activator FtrB
MIEASSSASTRAALDATPWLGRVAKSMLDRLAAQAVLHRVPVGSVLFEQSETPAFAQFLISGGVELIAVDRMREALIETVRPVDLLLPAAVLNRQPYLARARVCEDGCILLIHADTFRAAVAADHALCLAVLACQAAQFRRQVKLVKNLTLRSAEERVGCYLLRLVDGLPPQAAVQLPHDKRRIAWQLGMTRETFSRTLAAVARHGLCVTGNMVEITDPGLVRARFQLDPLIDADEPILPMTLHHARPSPHRRR